MPVEYREAGAPPPSWFIGELMKFYCQPYHVGLLSAAALHGAAHQQPQEFQVVTNKQLRPAAAGRARIRFFRKLRLDRTPTIEMKTETGVMRMATPEATALDLLRYLDRAGHLGHVVTELAELSEKMEAERLAQVAKIEASCRPHNGWATSWTRSAPTKPPTPSRPGSRSAAAGSCLSYPIVR